MTILLYNVDASFLCLEVFAENNTLFKMIIPY